MADAARRLVFLAATALLPLVPVDTALAQSARNVLVVANSNSPASVEIATYYVDKRAVPQAQLLRITAPAMEEISREVYVRDIERPIFNWIFENTAQDRILYIVLTKDVPLRIQGTSGPTATTASVDSELTLLYRRLAGTAAIPEAGPIRNPYFVGEVAPTERPFSHKDRDIYLVTRLDGFTVSDVKALIDRGVAPTRDRRSILLRTRSTGGGDTGDAWLAMAGRRISAVPGWEKAPIVTKAPRADVPEPLLGYYSWGSNDPATQLVSEQKVPFAPGALAGLFVSTDARTFHEPPEGWIPGQGVFAGSPQSLTGTLIRNGITGVAGHVFEPFLNAAIRPDILFPAYLRGANLAEAFYMATPYLSWQSVIIGDPLCAPFRNSSLATELVEPAVDTVTELPAFLSERRIAGLTGVGREPARLFVKSNQRLLKKDAMGARAALESAIKLDPKFAAAHLTLAALYDESGQYDASAQRYRTVLQLQPSNAAAMNNLAYLLAVKRNNPKEALPFARRAQQLAPNAANVMDTLAWVHHLLGDNKAAEPFILKAATAAPNNVEILLHAAVILEATGQIDVVRQLLTRAEAINPAATQTNEIKALRARVQKQGN